VFLSEGEDHWSEERSFEWWVKNIPCDDPHCKHPTTAKWFERADGARVYQRSRACAPRDAAQRIDMVIDKHAPSFIACARVNFLKVLLDSYHGYHAFTEYMISTVKVSKTTVAISFLDLAHRLYRRSSTAAQAQEMFTEFVNWVTSDDTSHLWTDKQAHHIVTTLENSGTTM
jgi:hypothetical protein